MTHAPDDRGRIAVRLAVRTDTDGTLYVANGGNGFRWKDVDAIQNLATTAKEVGEGIGNKGLGFRSTEALTDDVRIFSRQAGTPSIRFDGYSKLSAIACRRHPRSSAGSTGRASRPCFGGCRAVRRHHRRRTPLQLPANGRQGGCAAARPSGRPVLCPHRSSQRGFRPATQCDSDGRSCRGMRQRRVASRRTGGSTGSETRRLRPHRLDWRARPGPRPSARRRRQFAPTCSRRAIDSRQRRRLDQPVGGLRVAGWRVQPDEGNRGRKAHWRSAGVVRLGQPPA